MAAGLILEYAAQYTWYQSLGFWSHCLHSQEAEGWMKADVQLWLLCIQPGIPNHGIVLSTFRVGLPTFLKPLWSRPHRHTQRRVSKVILNPATWWWSSLIVLEKSAFISVVVIRHHDPKHLSGEKCSSQRGASNTSSYHTRRAERNECIHACLLASAFQPYTIQDPCLGLVPPTLVLGLLRSIILRQSPKDMPTGQPNEETPSLILTSQEILS